MRFTLLISTLVARKPDYSDGRVKHVTVAQICSLDAAASKTPGAAYLSAQAIKTRTKCNQFA